MLASPKARDPQLARDLWELSSQLVGTTTLVGAIA
jgi:hypothetical protein